MKLEMELENDIEKEMQTGVFITNQPIEIDIRKILGQLGIKIEKWPEEYKGTV